MIFSTGNGTPITPVLATWMCSSAHPRALASCATVRCVASTPAAPVQALAFPEFTMTAWARLALDRRTARSDRRRKIWFWVNTAAGHRAVRQDQPKVHPPLGLIPQRQPPKRNPGTWSGRSLMGFRVSAALTRRAHKLANRSGWLRKRLIAHYFCTSPEGEFGAARKLRPHRRSVRCAIARSGEPVPRALDPLTAAGRRRAAVRSQCFAVQLALVGAGRVLCGWVPGGEVVSPNGSVWHLPGRRRLLGRSPPHGRILPGGDLRRSPDLLDRPGGERRL